VPRSALDELADLTPFARGAYVDLGRICIAPQ
jgi:hypothetical protein